MRSVRWPGPVQVFKEHMTRERQAVAEREVERQQAETEKHAALVGMAETIETETGTALERIRQRTTAMTGTADEMTASAVRTGGVCPDRGGGRRGGPGECTDRRQCGRTAHRLDPRNRRTG